MKKSWLKLAAILLSPLAATALGESRSEASQGKWQYHLFKPVPRASMRPMSTDRPDKTESPYTVDAGHLQLEVDFVNLVVDSADGAPPAETSVGNVNFKAGVLNNMDFQLVLGNYLSSEQTPAGMALDRSFGNGEVTPRIKVNLWGNDGGRTASAVMLFATLPTGRGIIGRPIEGGIIFPVAVELPHDWEMGLMTEIDIVARGNGGYGPDFINSVTVSHPIVGNLSGYGEIFSQLSGEEPIITLDAGLNYALTEDIQVDCGCNFGVTRAAEDFNPFVGISMRF